MNITNVTAIVSPRGIALGSGIFMSIVLVFGIILNVFVLVVFAKNKQLLTAYNINIIALVVNNLCLCVFGFIMPIIAEFSGHFLIYMSMDMCIAEAFIVYFFGLASIYILVAVAITRYRVVVQKTRAVTKRTTILIVCNCEGTALMFAVAPLYGFGSYGLEAHGNGCGLDWKYSRDVGVLYIITIIILCFFLPISIMAWCYQRIYSKVSASCSKIRHSHRNRGGPPLKREAWLLRISVALLAGFIITWTPYVIVSFYTVIGNPKNLDPLLSRIASLLAKSQVILNTILYVFAARDFQELVISVFRGQRNDAAFAMLRRTDTETNQSGPVSNTHEQSSGVIVIEN